MARTNTLQVNGKTYHYYPLADLGDISHLPFSLKILLENLLRHNASKESLNDIIQGNPSEIAFKPARILMQDFTGVPAIVDLAAMRDAMKKNGGDPMKVNPMIPVDLVTDHSVTVDSFGNTEAFEKNVSLEYERNFERYEFLHWGQTAFKNFRVVPPGTGICHQVNLEYLGKVVWIYMDENGNEIAYPDTVFGTDSHTTMINALSILGWGVGGIEAEAAMLGQPISMLIPEVVGVHLKGTLPEGSTATDLVLTITNLLRKKGVVGKFVEFFGNGLDHLSLADRATVSNMAPEYGATCGFFPIDQETINYLTLTGRSSDQIALVEAYAKAQGLWRTKENPVFKDVLEIDLGTIQPTLAGPKRPQDKILLPDMKKTALSLTPKGPSIEVTEKDYSLHNHDVVIAAITSCTNTSNPSVMIGAALVAKKAKALGLRSKPWVKTSLAPGSQVVTEYLENSGLMKDLEDIGFYLVGYGCTTCIGNSGPLAPEISKAIKENDLTVSGVLSGNRNFEGRIHPEVKANYLASPPLVVAYALAGTTAIDLQNEPIGKGTNGKDIYLRDIWPSSAEIKAVIQQFVTPETFKKKYQDVFKGDKEWQKIKSPPSVTYNWSEKSTYIKNLPYFNEKNHVMTDIKGARILALLGDSITTDHISPAGNIKARSPAGHYLSQSGVSLENFNAYGTRRGNHEAMMRGTFANVRLQNEMTPGRVGGVTLHLNDKAEEMSIYDAAMKYQEKNTPLVIFAGKEYGSGSSRDWAAKGTRLLGVKAVIAESFERIHRSNLVGMGVLPLEFPKDVTRKTLGLNGKEYIHLLGLENGIKPGMKIVCLINTSDGKQQNIDLNCRIDTQDEVEYFQKGGILPYVLELLNK
ncbi:MAG: aconitate hydratase AcnA [Alphaproteobacteria bacterium]|nr:aconitate hydratase AcnA [Alphaproteobacteria bacterium]